MIREEDYPSQTIEESVNMYGVPSPEKIEFHAAWVSLNRQNASMLDDNAITIASQ